MPRLSSVVSLHAAALAALCVLTAATAADTGLIQAVKNGSRDSVIAILARKNVDVNVSEADGTRALHWAVQQDDFDLAMRLLRAGAQVSLANRYGVTPLYLACVNGNAAMISLLLKAGADPNSESNEGETALMTVARTGHVDAARILVAAGAKIDAREQWRGQTALMWAASQRHPEMMRYLIEQKADVNARSAVKVWERQVTSEPRDKWLPPGGMTPLLFASRDGCLECVKILAEAGADINATDPDGISGIISATINGHYDIGVYLAQRGANVNLADKTGRTALYAAADFNTMPQSNRPSPHVLDNVNSALDLMRVLLEHGANPNAQLEKQIPYRVKLDRGDDTMLTTGTTPLLRAAKAGDITAMELLLSRGADPKLSTRTGINPLMAAAGLGTKEEDTTGRFKTEEQAIRAIELCLQGGVPINAKDARGQTALHGAAFWGKDKIVQFLADQGADVNAKDNRGLTARDAALGKAGGVGFDGASVTVRQSTADLLEKLAAKP
jgi:ankyrin repeat protein